MSKDVAAGVQPVALTETEKAYGRTGTRLQVAAAVWTLWDRLRKEQGLDQQWLADRMGKSKSRVSRLLKGPGNWTLDTVGDLLEAMQGRLTCVEAHTYDEIARGEAWKATLRERHRRVAYVKMEMMVVEDDGPGVDMIAYDALDTPALSPPTLTSSPALIRQVAA